jgi:glycosyltransferase involved in cell wall biosynthesis
MKVLHVTCGLEPDMGGPPVSVTTFCIAGIRAGIETSLAFTYNRASIRGTRSTRRTLRAAGVHLLPYRRTGNFGTKSKTWGLSAALIVSLFRHAKEYDIIVVHGPWPATSLAGLLAAKLRGVKCILVPHESLTAIDMNKPGWLGRIALKRLLRRLYFRACDRVIVASPLEHEDSRDIRGAVAIVVIPHAVYDDKFVVLPESRAALRVEPVLGFIGRLHFKKNVDVLLRAMALLPAPIRLRIAGVGPHDLTTNLKDLAISLGVADRVEWLGLVTGSDKTVFFKSIDLLIMPSLYESFGLVAAESIMNGVPAIVSPSTGVAGLITDHDCGLVVQPTPEAIADGVRKVFSDEDLYRRLSANALDAARSEVGYTAFARRIQSLYFETIGIGDIAVPEIARSQNG